MIVWPVAEKDNIIATKLNSEILLIFQISEQLPPYMACKGHSEIWRDKKNILWKEGEKVIQKFWG